MVENKVFMKWASNISRSDWANAIICQHEEDAKIYTDAGYKNVLVLPASCVRDNLDCITDSLSLFTPFEVVYIAVPEKGFSKVIRLDLSRKLGKENCKLANFGGYKSITEYYQQEGETAVQLSIQKAISFPLEGIIEVKQLDTTMLDTIYQGGFNRGLLFGMPKFDDLYSIKRKLLTVITGPPGTGKTEIWMTCAVNMIKNNPQNNIRLAIFSPESRPIERLVIRLAEAYMNKPVNVNAFNRANKEELNEAIRWVEEHFVFIHKGGITDSGKTTKTKQGTSLNNLLNYVRLCVKHHGIFGYLGDPWNKLEHDIPVRMTEKQYISASLDLILDNADYNDIHAWWIAHPTKTHIDPVSKNKRVISLADISGASEWESKPDVGIVLHRPLFEKVNEISTMGQPTGKKVWSWNPTLPTQVMVQKMKFEEVGKLGFVDMYYNRFGGKNFVEKKEDLVKKPGEGEALTLALPAEDKESDWVPF